MKTPEEIKKGLEACGTLDGDCENCPYDDGKQLTCAERLRRDALEYIQRLEEVIECSTQIVRAANELSQKRMSEMESSLAQVERERDALICFIQKESFPAVISGIPEACQWCKHLGDFTKEVCKFCGTHDVFGNFEYRGVCEENTHDQT